MHGYVDVEQGQVHYTSLGAGPHTLCLFHETPVNGRYFSPCMPRLSQRFRVVAFDTPGYGQSSPLEGSATIESYADALWRAITGLGLQRVAVAGVHTGAALCVELMRRQPQQIIAGVLSGIPLLNPEQRDRLRQHVEQRSAALDTESLAGLWADRKTRWFGAPDALLIEALASELQAFERRDLGLSAVAEYDMDSALTSVRCPLMILNGRKDSLIAADERVAARFPVFDVKILENRGGQLPWTAAAEYSEHLSNFLSTHFAASVAA